ncbi:MAG: hypothetical protein WD795_16995 [Woeseia sp.]
MSPRRALYWRRRQKIPLIPFVEREAMHKVWRNPGYSIRLFDPRGHYPAGKIAAPNALYWGAPDLTFMATWSAPWDWYKLDMPYTEMDWATPQELKLLASILLCEREDGPRTCFYPVHRFSMRLDAEKLNLESPWIATRIKDSIIERSHRPDMMIGEGAILECRKGKYSLFKKSCLEIARQPEFFERISTDDYLFLRGIGALLKADMLTRHYEFWEEAIVISFIALEASFQMVLRELRQSGIVEPTSKDAAAWLHQSFNEPFGLEPVERYFQAVYDQRIMTLHPVSRLGVNPYAPLFHDDYSLLRRDVPSIFAYLLTGRHSPEYLTTIARFGKTNSNRAGGQERKE